ncbi:beta strand repeat-containing protein [Mesorhizobium sp. NPDC059054]|uniref:beta strand repeat-containing protein n=1 Tax=Mesorhizobium sp. NPDC059054 TaxID=3346711 RepID=UPI0036C8C279
MGGYGDGSSGRAGWAGKPILLDLSGKGLSIDTLGSSQQFIDLDGDGYQHRTAWAGDGTGVLVLDADGDGKISRSSEFMFTEWDQTAQSDLEAIKNVFDTNHNGLLDAGDLRWADFKVMINGQLVSLDSLGITSIGLTPKGSSQNFEDGSSITGTAEYTKSDGTTGTVGDAVLAVDPNGYVIKTVTTTDADGSKTVDLTGYNKDGTLAFRNRTVTSADGQSRTTQFDDDGNGTWDRSQTDITTLVAGERQRVVSNFNADGSLKDRITTVTSADGKTVTTSLDQDGDGNTDQTQIYVVNADGSTTTTISQFAVDGTLQKKVSITSSSDGLSKTTSTDSDGDGTYDVVVGETTVVGGDGSRTKTVERRGNDGTLIGRETTVTSVDGRTKTVSHDLDGNGAFETRDESSINVDTNGVVTTTVSTFSGTNSLISKTVATQSADGLVKTQQTDVDGDGTFDVSASDTTVVASDGSRTQTEHTKSAAGTLLGQTVTTTSADRKSISIISDSNGDGKTDATTTIVVDASGVTTTTKTASNADGSVKGSTWDQSSADGLSVTTKADLNGDGVYDVIATDVTTTDGSNNQVRILNVTSANGTVVGGKVLTTSADSLTQTLREDLDGDGTADLVTTKSIVLASDGSRTETTSSYNANGSLLDKTTIAVSADRKTSTTTLDADGDGHIDRTVTEIEAANGSHTITVVDTSADGVQHAKSETVRSGNELIVTEKLDLNGDGAFDVTTRSETIIGTDASRTTTVEKTAGNGALIGKSTSTTSANGLSVTTQADADGDGIYDVKSTDTTVLNGDGSKARTVSDFAGTSLVRNSITTTSANGLSSTTQVDLDGNGTIDQTTAVAAVLAADGSRSETTTIRSGDGSLLGKTTTVVSADKTLSITSTDANGDGQNDYVKTTSIAADGTTSVTEETFNANGSRDAKTLITASANGLAKTKKTDINGDGVYDLTETDATVLNTDGSRTRTISTSSSNGSLIGKAVSTTSGNGLVTTTLTDSTGDGVVDWKVVDRTALGSDGSQTQTVTTRSGNDTLVSQKTTVQSGNGRTVTTTTDANGDGAIDSTETTALLDNGSVEKITKLTAVDGSTISQKKATVSADGLAKTVQTDIDGDGTYDDSMSETTILNADGSRKTTTQWRTGNGTLTASTETNVSRNGLATVTSTDLNGDGIIDESSSDVTTLNADGSRARTVSHFDGANGLRDKTTTTTSANGYSVTTASDLDGNGTVDRTSTTVRTLASDGSVTDSSSVLSGSGGLISKTSTSTSTDRKQVTTQNDLDGDGNDDVVKSIVNQPNGSVTETVSTYVGTDLTRTLASLSIKTTSADGLVTTIETDTNGDGTTDRSSRSETVLNADGSKTQTFTNFDTGGSIKDKSIVDTSANGLVVSTQWMAKGTSVTRSLDDVTTLNADGSTVRSLTYKKAGGALESKSVTTTSADKKTVTTAVDTDGNGVIDQKSTGVVNADGSVTTTYLDLGSDGILVTAKKIVTESANGLTVTTDFDTNGDGTVDNRVVEATVLNADGSKTTTITRFSGTSQAIERTVIAVSADGKTRTDSYDLNADGTVDKKEAYSTTFGERAGYGFATTETMETSIGGVVKSRYQTTTSGNGRSNLKEWDVDGNGSVDQTATETIAVTDQGTTRTVTAFAGSTKLSSTTTTTSTDGRTVTTVEERPQLGFSNRTITTSVATLADGSTIEKTTLTNTTNGVVEKRVTTTSADGREVIIERDIDGNGTVDQLEQRTKYVDGSTKTVITGNGSYDKTTFMTSADGLSSTVEWDMDLDGTVDRRRITANSLQADGSQTSLSTDYKIVAGSADTRVRIVSSSVSADGRSKTLSIDTNGDGVFDKVALTKIDASGGAVTTTTNNTEAQKAENLVLGEIYWKQAIAAKVVTTVSSDGLTTTEQSDFDGNGTLETTAVSRTRVDGSVVTEFAEVNASGGVIAKGTLTVSNDGRTKILSKDSDNDGLYDHGEKTELFIDGTIVRTTSDYNADGTLKQSTGENITSTGKLTHRTVRDGAGHKTEEYLLWSTGTAAQYTYVGADEAIRSSHSLNKDGKLVGGTFYDPKNTDLWTRIEQSFNADGKKTLEKQFMDDGTRVDITFDVSTGKQIQGLTYDTSNRLIAQATYSNGVLASNVLYDPANAKSWSRVEQTYTSDGTKVSLEKQFMDDGTRAEITFDPANAEIWTTTTNYYDIAGRLIQNSIAYDDGRARHDYKDATNANAWTNIVQWRSSTNALLEQYQFNDDGTKSYTVYDVASTQTWKEFTYYYDSAERLIQYNLTYDDNSKYIEFRDLSNASSWSTIVQHFNVYGQQTDHIQTNDDGTGVQIYYDPTNAQNYSVVYYYVDTAGRVTNESIYYDDGTRYYDYRDAANTQSWNLITQYFDSSNRITAQNQYNDDGSKSGTAYDATNANSWYSYTVFYNSSNQYYQETTIYDDNSRVDIWQGALVGQTYKTYQQNSLSDGRVTYTKLTNYNNTYTATDYDVYSQYSWTRWERFYSSDNVLMSDKIYYDNGSVGSTTGPVKPGGGGGHGPVVLDLDQDGSIGIQTLAPQGDQSGPRFDWNGDGLRDQTSWASAGDAFLAIDLAADGSAGPDGVIDQAKELAFNLWINGENGATSDATDLDALRLIFDTNQDNVFDSSDARWNEFRVWRDANQNGVTDAGELMTLAEVGVMRIGLVADPQGSEQFADGSEIYGTSWFETVGGTRNLVGDVKLVSRPAEPEPATEPTLANGTGAMPANLKVDSLVAAMASFGANTSAGTTELSQDGSETIGAWKPDHLAVSSQVWSAA